MIQITFTPETPEQAAVVAEAIGKYLGTVPVGGTVAEVEEPAAVSPKRKSKSTGPASSPASASSPTASTTSAESSAEVPNEPAAEPSEPEAPAASTASSEKPADEVPFAKIVERITVLNKSDKPGHGREGVMAILKKYLPDLPKPTVTLLQPLGMNAAILADIDAALTPAAEEEFDPLA